MEIHDRDEIINENLKNETKVFNFQEVLEEEARLLAEKLEAEKPTKKGGKQSPTKEKAKEEKSKKKDTKKKDVKLAEPIREEKEIVKINSSIFGLANFYLSDLLKTGVRDLKLRGGVYPNKKFEVKKIKFEILAF